MYGSARVGCISLLIMMMNNEWPHASSAPVWGIARRRQQEEVMLYYYVTLCLQPIT